MSWKTPLSEEAWEEYLSAYVDGELAPEEREPLEAHLKTDPSRADQVRALEKVSSVLREWNVETPDPSPVILDRLDRAPTKPPRVRWSLAAAVFVAGLAAGVLGTLALQGPPTEPPQQVVETRPAEDTTLAGAPPDSSISPAQAEDLLREVTAGGIKTKLTESVRRRKWQAAAQLYHRLLREFGDTEVAATLDTEREVRRLKRVVPLQERSES